MNACLCKPILTLTPSFNRAARRHTVAMFLAVEELRRIYVKWQAAKE